MDRLEAMRAFAAVAQENSFTAGGRRLSRSTKLVSKQVAQLEAAFGVQLFNRTTRSVALTDPGRALLSRCLPILDQVDEIEAVLQERQTRLAGPIRITAPTMFGSRHLPAALAGFLDAHDRVTVELRLSDHVVALVEEGFDLAIRIGTLRDSSLVARRLAAMPIVTCAAPRYLERHGRPSHPSALATHNCLVDDNRTDSGTWRFKSGPGEETVRVGGRFRANSPGAVAEMAIAGLGIGQCPEYVVREALADGRLVRLFADREPDQTGLFAVYPPNRHLTARVRGLIDHLATVFAGPPAA